MLPLVFQVAAAAATPAPAVPVPARALAVDVWVDGGGFLAPSFARRPDAPPPSLVMSGMRAEVRYTEWPTWGLSLGAAVRWLWTPGSALALAPVARFSFPSRPDARFSGSVGLLGGAMQGLTGARSFRAWLAVDVRFQVRATRRLSPFLCATIESAPADWVGLSAGAGLSIDAW